MQYIASISHGKDSIAMLHIIKDVLKLPLDRIITVDVWFDENTRAELPPMVEWKEKADKIIFDKWGIPVEHLCATRGGNEIPTQDYSTNLAGQENTVHISMVSQNNEGRGATPNSRLTYKELFYRVHQRGKKIGQMTGFPMIKGNWCTSDLKRKPLNFSIVRKVGWCNT